MEQLKESKWGGCSMKNKISDFSWRNTGLLFAFGGLLSMLYGLIFVKTTFGVSVMDFFRGGTIIVLTVLFVIMIGNYVKGLKWMDKTPAFIFSSVIVAGLIRFLFTLPSLVVPFRMLFMSAITQMVLTLIAILLVMGFNEIYKN